MKLPGSLPSLLITAALSCAAGFAQDKVLDESRSTAQPESRPACTAAMLGQLWPEEALDPQFAAALAPYGYPMICTRNGSSYTWQSPTVHVNQLKKNEVRKQIATPASTRHAPQAQKPVAVKE